MAWREARNSPSESRQYPLPADYKVMLPGYYGRREGRTCFNILTLDNQPPLCFSAYLVGVDVEWWTMRPCRAAVAPRFAF
jgi:hypothetical protein